MINYSTYDFYVSEYGGQMSDFDFNKSAIKASAYLEKITFGKIANYAESREHELQYAICEMSDTIKTAESSKSNGKTVVSASNDGYSETYDVTEKKNELYDIATLYLPVALFEAAFI